MGLDSDVLQGINGAFEQKDPKHLKEILAQKWDSPVFAAEITPALQYYFVYLHRRLSDNNLEHYPITDDEVRRNLDFINTEAPKPPHPDQQQQITTLSEISKTKEAERGAAKIRDHLEPKQSARATKAGPLSTEEQSNTAPTLGGGQREE
jgi:hypothetical protein